MPEMNAVPVTPVEQVIETLDQDEQYQVEMFQKSIDILKQFKTADEIAAFLEAQKIKATPGSSSSCAISEYIKRNLGL